MRFGPENEDLSHHPEKLLRIWVWAGQPPSPTESGGHDSKRVSKEANSL